MMGQLFPHSSRASVWKKPVRASRAAFCFFVAAARDSVQPDPPVCPRARWGTVSVG